MASYEEVVSNILRNIGVSGQGELNYISNPNFSSSTTGWTDNTGGMTITRTDVASELPREFLTETAGKVVASTATAGDYVAFDFDLDDSDKTRKLKIQWDQLVLPDSGNVYTSGDFEVVVRDLDNSTDITPVTTSIPARNGTFVTTFSVTNSQNYELRIKTTVTDSDGLSISNVIVGPGHVNKGASISGEVDISNEVVWTNDSGHSPSEAVVKYHRVGEFMVLKFNYEATGDGTDTGAFALQLPSGLTGNEVHGTELGAGRINATSGGKHAAGSWWDNNDGSIKFHHLEGTASASIDGDEIGPTKPWDQLHFNSIVLKIAEWTGLGVQNQLQQDNLSIWKPIPESSVSNLTTNIQAEGGFFRQVGDSMQVRAAIEFSGANTDGGVDPIIPNNESVDLSKIFSGLGGLLQDKIAIGSWVAHDDGSGSHSGTVTIDASTGSIELADGNGDFRVNTAENRPFTIADGDVISWQFEVPIEGFDGDQGTLAGFSEATADHAGLGKKNKWAVHYLSNDIDSTDSNGELDVNSHITDLTFNNLEIGKHYEVFVQAEINAEDGDTVLVKVVHNGNTKAVARSGDSDGSSDNADTITAVAHFKATTNTVEFEVTSLVSPSLVRGSGDEEKTFAKLIERNDLSARTTDFD